MTYLGAESSEGSRTSSIGNDRKRHCWECLRRRLVCDSARPVCKRCSAHGIECPGYDNVKPLKFLVPGRVLSRNRKAKGSAFHTIENDRNKSTKIEAELSLRIEDVDVPRFEIKTEACDIIQAIQYYNTCIYEEMTTLWELQPTPHIYPLTPALLQYVNKSPRYLLLSFVCMSLVHRINRTRNDSRSYALFETVHQYWGAVIRALREDINVEHRRTSDFMIAGIITCLLSDVQQGGSSNWRCHLDGTQRLITLRGSIRALAGSTTLDPLLHCFLCVAILGNTTSPASDLCMAISHFNEVDLIVDHYGCRPFAFQMCPQPLLAEIIRVNHLRKRATKLTVPEDLSHEAYEILDRIDEFSTERWAESRSSSKEDWILLGNIYRTAVALYCISSLQSVSVLPLSSSLRARCSTHGQLLHILLNEALSSPRINRFMLWPLVVLGVQAANGDLEMRLFVEKQLPEMSRRVGTSVPLTAKGVIEKFWASGETRWDACFDRPYVFVTQIAVDLQQFIPYLQ